MTDGVSGRQLAKLLGISEPAVRKAAKAKRIPQLADGSFDPDACRSAWARSTDPARVRACGPANQAREPGSRVRTPEVRTPAVRTEADAQAAVTLIRRVLQAEGADTDEIGFGAARTADTILKAYERDLKLAERRKQLVPIARVKSHIEKAFIGIRQAIQRMPSRHVPAMAAELGCDPAALDAAWTKAIAAELDALSTPVVRA